MNVTLDPGRMDTGRNLADALLARVREAGDDDQHYLGEAQGAAMVLAGLYRNDDARRDRWLRVADEIEKLFPPASYDPEPAASPWADHISVTGNEPSMREFAGMSRDACPLTARFPSHLPGKLSSCICPVQS